MLIFCQSLTFFLFMLINRFQNTYMKNNKQIIKTYPEYYHNNQHKYYKL